MNKNPLRPRPRSVAVPNVEAVRAEEVTQLLTKIFFGVHRQARLEISKNSQLELQAMHAEEVRLVSLPGRQTAELVQVVLVMTKTTKR